MLAVDFLASFTGFPVMDCQDEYIVFLLVMYKEVSLPRKWLPLCIPSSLMCPVHVIAFVCFC